ncbi:Hypothetical predicted protein [Xyrichtys novacula]|uniref:Uncharacterized protein n=1 Tax=Xyrichtys novacula TaxID=13765 RepID=A0AAV1EJ59_XYRNO|nr:Hypothetical predicted protein [Xyrichtys novacula]
MACTLSVNGAGFSEYYAAGKTATAGSAAALRRSGPEDGVRGGSASPSETRDTARLQLLPVLWSSSTLSCPQRC